MGNWYGHSRTNYFEVKDKETFKEEFSPYEIQIIEKEDSDFLMFYSTTHDGDMPVRMNDSEDLGIPITEDIAKHLKDHSVCVVMTIGNEKERYYTGVATAINAQDERVTVSLNDIYQQAAEFFGDDKTITEATY